jgi:hypothetical protein
MVLSINIKNRFLEIMMVIFGVKLQKKKFDTKNGQDNSKMSFSQKNYTTLFYYNHKFLQFMMYPYLLTSRLSHKFFRRSEIRKSRRGGHETVVRLFTQ